MSHVDTGTFTPQEAVVETSHQTTMRPEIVPDIDTIDFWTNSPEESQRLKDQIQRDIFAKSTVFDVLQAGQALEMLNSYGHAGQGIIIERSDLMQYLVPIPGTNDSTCARVGVTHSLSLFYNAGIDEYGRKIFGRFAFVIGDDGDFGLSFSSSERPTHNSARDTLEMTEGPGFYPVASLGALRSRQSSSIPYLPIIVGGEITPSASLLLLRLTTLTEHALVDRMQLWRESRPNIDK